MYHANMLQYAMQLSCCSYVTCFFVSSHPLGRPLRLQFGSSCSKWSQPEPTLHSLSTHVRQHQQELLQMEPAHNRLLQHFHLRCPPGPLFQFDIAFLQRYPLGSHQAHCLRLKNSLQQKQHRLFQLEPAHCCTYTRRLQHLRLQTAARAPRPHHALGCCTFASTRLLHPLLQTPAPAPHHMAAGCCAALAASTSIWAEKQPPPTSCN